MLHCCELMKIFSYTRNVGYIISIIYIMLYISTITVLDTEIFEMSSLYVRLVWCLASLQPSQSDIRHGGHSPVSGLILILILILILTTEMKIFILCCLFIECQPVEWEKISERIFNKITSGLKQSVLNGE